MTSQAPAAPPPIKYTSSCREDQRLSTEVKIVSKYCNISKTLGRGSNTPSPPPPCTTVGVWICVYVPGLNVCDAYKLRCSFTCTTNGWNSYFYFHSAHRIQDFFNHVLALWTCSAVPRKWARLSLMNIWTPHSSLISFSLLSWRPITSPNFFRRDLYLFLLVC